MPKEVAVIAVFAIAFGSMMVVSLGRLVLKAIELRHKSLPPASFGTMEDRLAHIEQAVDAMAVEVERISEGQRFVTKLLAARGTDAAPLPAPARE